MIKKLLSFLGFAGKTVKDGTGKSLDFVDDLLESEHITNTIDKAKDLTGSVVEKAGEAFEKTKMAAEDLMDNENIKSVTDKAKEIGNQIADKAEEVVDKVSENDAVKGAIDKAKEVGSGIAAKAEDLKDKAEDFIDDKVLGEEE